MPEIGKDEFRCTVCGEVFKKGWSDEEAAAELEEEFGMDPTDCAMVCDDCYKVHQQPAKEYTAHHQAVPGEIYMSIEDALAWLPRMYIEFGIAENIREQFPGGVPW